MQPSSVDCMVFGCTSTTAIIAYHNFHFFLVYLTQPLWQSVLNTILWQSVLNTILWQSVLNTTLWQSVLDTTSMAMCTWYLHNKVYLIRSRCTWYNLYGKVYLIQPLWQGAFDTTLWQGVLDTTSMAMCTWYLHSKVYLIRSRCTWYNLYGKVYLIQPLWKGVFETASMTRCIWYNLYGKMCLIPLWQGVLDTTSMVRCTCIACGKMYLIWPLWQCVPDTTSMARCTRYNLCAQYLDVLSGEIEKNLYKICILYI